MEPGALKGDAQDTIKIAASNINTKVLIPGTHRYLVYFKLGKDSTRKLYQLWSRSIAFIDYEGKEAISVTQEWEDNDTIIHKTYSVLSKKEFSTLFHESWWKKPGKVSFDFIRKVARGKDGLLSEKKDSNNIKFQKAFEVANFQYFLNWHLDIEIFPLLPYKNDVTFSINFYDLGFGSPKWINYTATGSATLNGYDNQKIDCWLLLKGPHWFGSDYQSFLIGFSCRADSYKIPALRQASNVASLLPQAI